MYRASNLAVGSLGARDSVETKVGAARSHLPTVVDHRTSALRVSRVRHASSSTRSLPRTLPTCCPGLLPAWDLAAFGLGAARCQHGAHRVSQKLAAARAHLRRPELAEPGGEGVGKNSNGDTRGCNSKRAWNIG
jgi:hypothetical protein